MANRHLGCDLGVEAGLAPAHALLLDERSLAGVERRELDEHRARQARIVVRQQDARASRRSRVRLRDHDRLRGMHPAQCGRSTSSSHAAVMSSTSTGIDDGT